MKSSKTMIALGLALSAIVSAQAMAATETSSVDPLLLPYAKPDILAKLPDGRAIHLKCMGAGSPTVILNAGLGDWSEVWRKVQPSVATTTRVCAWDRAGFGFSDGSLRPQTVANTTSDLEGALRAARVPGPYVMVGHSLGGYESLLFADQHRDAVVGMVLVDPAIPDQFARLRRASPALAASLEAVDRMGADDLRICEAAVKSGKVTPGSPYAEGCLVYPPTYPPKTTAALSKLDVEPGRWAAKLSLLENVELSGRLVVNPARNYGAMPLVVLTAAMPQSIPNGLPSAIAEGYAKGYPAYLAEWTRAHDELAALSSRGRNQLVSDSTHYIQVERPDVVIDAISEVVNESRHAAGAERHGAGG
jgi:pimeloyl-ACP methyl ester carboxylesterase